MKPLIFYYALLLSLVFSISLLSKDTLLPDQRHFPKQSEVADFFDTLVHKKLEELNVPGVVISITHTDSLFFSKGYGYADLDQKTPVDPEKTIWRLASISKVITGTAVMQLVERGVLDLDTDVNEYLKEVTIPKTFDAPITLRYLLTHTSGFDDRYLNKSFRTEAEWPPLDEFIKSILPDRLYPPGVFYSYSNIGNALAALVVEDVTGQDFNEYCREHIFLPLDMQRTSFRVLDDEMRKSLCTGYYHDGKSFQETPFDYLGDYPAGQLLSTAEEFTHFMISILNNGTYQDTRLLDSATLKAMITPQFTQHPKLQGSVGFTFHMGVELGNPVIRHDGGYMGLTTRMYLLPEQNVGIFMAGNISGVPILDALTYPFIEKYFNNEKPDDRYPLEELPEFDPDVEKYTGYYRSTRYSHRDITKAFLLAGFMQEVQLWKNDNGMLLMNDLEGNQRRLIQVEPGLFQSLDDNYYLAFKLDRKNNPVFLFTHGTGALEKVPAFWAIPNQQMIILSTLTFFILLFLFLTVSRNKTKSVVLRRMHSAALFTAVLFILHWVALGTVLFWIIPYHELSIGLAYGLPGYFYGVQLLPVLGIGSLILLVYYWLVHLGSAQIKGAVKIGYLMYILICIGYLWIINYWNLLGFHFG